MATEGEMGFVGNVGNGFLTFKKILWRCKVAVRLDDMGTLSAASPSVLAATEKL